MSDLNQGIPPLPHKMVDENGAPLGVWYAFFLSLWKRTGGATASISGILDAISNSPGSTLYRGAVEWAGLAIGPRYTVLRSGANYPEWDFLDGSSFGPRPANTVLAGPAAGGAAITTFRTLASADLESLAGEYPGTGTNDNASAGNIGEYAFANAGAVALTSGVSADLANITLSPGDWDVWGSVATAPAGTTTQSQVRGWINILSATDPGAPNSGCYANLNVPIPAGLGQCLPLGMKRITVLTGTTQMVYLSAAVTFATSTLTATGFIGARRRR